MNGAVRFDTPENLLAYIQSGHDVWSPSEKLYAFVYNEHGSIAVYQNISRERAEHLDKGNEYWGAYLGIGGSIYDTEEYIREHEGEEYIDDAKALHQLPIQWAEDVWSVTDWIDVTK